MLTTYDDINIEIDEKQVYRYLGYGAGHRRSARTSSIINEYIENAHHLIEASYSYVTRDIERVRRSCVFVEGSIMFRSEVIAGLLEQCCCVSVFIATIGSRLEETVLKLAEERLVLQSAVLDAIGSAAVDGLAGLVQAKIAEEAGNKGLCISQRFSPGYCDWTIRQQEAVFRIIGENSNGVSLTEGYLMIPRKSISGVIGIGLSSSSVMKYNPCKTCGKQDCRGRR